jgi:hypothetical protein
LNDDVKVETKESVKNLVTYMEIYLKIKLKKNSPLRNVAVYDGKCG